jgi:hypothetical protein
MLGLDAPTHRILPYGEDRMVRCPAPDVPANEQQLPKCLVSLNRLPINRKTEVLLRRSLSRKAPRFYTLSDISRGAADKKIRHQSIDTLRLERFRYGDIHNSRSTGNEAARER